MRPIDFILETLGHFVKRAEGPPPGIPVHVGPEFESELTWLCEWHRITPIVVESLERLALRPRISRISLERMKALSRASAALATELLGTTESLLAALSERNVDSLLMDDVVFPMTVYPSPSVRPIEAITLLVRERDWRTLIDVCRTVGFRRDPRAPALRDGKEALLFHQNFTPCVLSSERGDHLQLKFRLLDIGGTAEAEPAWSNGWAVPGHDTMRRISIEDQLIQSCVAYNMTAFSKLLYAVDVGLIITRCGGELNWRYIEDRLRARAVYPAVTLTLRQVVRWFKLDGSRLPLEAPGPVRRELFDLLWHPAWIGSALKRPTHPRRFRFFFLETGNLLDKLRMVFTLLSPRRDWVSSFFGRPYRPWLKLKFIVLALRNRLGVTATG